MNCRVARGKVLRICVLFCARFHERQPRSGIRSHVRLAPGARRSVHCFVITSFSSSVPFLKVREIVLIQEAESIIRACSFQYKSFPCFFRAVFRRLLCVCKQVRSKIGVRLKVQKCSVVCV